MCTDTSQVKWFLMKTPVGKPKAKKWCMCGNIKRDKKFLVCFLSSLIWGKVENILHGKNERSWDLLFPPVFSYKVFFRALGWSHVYNIPMSQQSQYSSLYACASIAQKGQLYLKANACSKKGLFLFLFKSCHNVFDLVLEPLQLDLFCDWMITPVEKLFFPAFCIFFLKFSFL